VLNPGGYFIKPQSSRRLESLAQLTCQHEWSQGYFYSPLPPSASEELQLYVQCVRWWESSPWVYSVWQTHYQCRHIWSVIKGLATQLSSVGRYSVYWAFLHKSPLECHHSAFSTMFRSLFGRTVNSSIRFCAIFLCLSWRARWAASALLTWVSVGWTFITDNGKSLTWFGECRWCVCKGFRSSAYVWKKVKKSARPAGVKQLAVRSEADSRRYLIVAMPSSEV